MAAADLKFRRAEPGEGPALTELALRSKSHWGYDDDFLEASRPYLTLEEGTIRAARVFVCERSATVLGFYGLTGEPRRGALDWLFLEPAYIAQGLGRRLWQHALGVAAVAGFTELTIESDRFAEPFYLAMGAQRVGLARSPVDGGELPIMQAAVPA